LSIRHEIRGAWSEWVTEDIRNIPLLNPTLLTNKQIEKIVNCWGSIENLTWDQLKTQFNDAIDNSTHPRRKLDEAILDSLNIMAKDGLNAYYRDLKNEIELLGNLMKTKPDVSEEKPHRKLQMVLDEWI
jgi:hypothetical protein